MFPARHSTDLGFRCVRWHLTLISGLLALEEMMRSLLVAQFVRCIQSFQQKPRATPEEA